MKPSYNIMKSKKKINFSKHHILTMMEVREKLLEIIDKPITDKEYEIFETLVKRCHNSLPKLRIPNELHRRIHTKK